MRAKRILVIEDDPEIAQLLQLELGEEGYEVSWAPSGMQGLVQVREDQPDLVILDLGLPDLDGGEVVRRVKSSVDLPIIVLTATDMVERKVSLLLDGADDYVTKPFYPQELLARVQVQLRHQEGGEILTVDELVVHLGRREAFFKKHVLHLSPKEFELLTLLAGRPGKVFNRSEIERRLWGKILDSSSNVVDVHMANMRSKLREAGAYGYLRTVRGVGYALRKHGE